MAYEVGSSLSIKNLLNLTPLTLSAKLARVEMFYHILKLEREIYWQIGIFIICYENILVCYQIQVV